MLGNISLRRAAPHRVPQERRAAARSAAGGGGEQPRLPRAIIEPVILALYVQEAVIAMCTGVQSNELRSLYD